MSLVSNFIGGISGVNLGGNVASGFSLNDTTFSDILEKQMEVKTGETNSVFGALGMPAGFEIEGLDFSEKAADQIEALGVKINTEDANNQLFDFARKQAANFYNKYSGNVVTDLQGFVSDVLRM